MMLSLMFLWWDKIALRLRSSGPSYAPLAIWEINWRFYYDLCDQVAICLRSERIAMDLCASESTDGDHGDQLETNQRSIGVLEDPCALHVLYGALTERRLVECGVLDLRKIPGHGKQGQGSFVRNLALGSWAEGHVRGCRSPFID